MNWQMDIFKTNSYHNSLPERDKNKLKEYETKAKRLEDIILRIFETNKYKNFTPAEIYLTLGQQYLITSVRRSITNLTTWGKLYMTKNKRQGLYKGRDNKCWQYLQK